jgi:hypothetical protein
MWSYFHAEFILRIVYIVRRAVSVLTNWDNADVKHWASVLSIGFQKPGPHAVEYLSTLNAVSPSLPQANYKPEASLYLPLSGNPIRWILKPG